MLQNCLKFLKRSVLFKNCKKKSQKLARKLKKKNCNYLAQNSKEKFGQNNFSKIQKKKKIVKHFKNYKY